MFGTAYRRFRDGTMIFAAAVGVAVASACTPSPSAPERPGAGGSGGAEVITTTAAAIEYGLIEGPATRDLP